MPISVPVVRTGNIVTPQSVPAGVVGVNVASGNYVFDTTDDFFDPGIAPRLGSNVLSTPLVVNPRFAGMHYHVQRPTVAYSVARNVDVPGCMWFAIASAGRGLYDWSTLDAFVAYKFAGRYRVSVNVYNLADRLNYTQMFGNRAVPAAGRTVIVGLGATF